MKPREIELPAIFWIILILIFIAGLCSCELLPSAYEIYTEELETIDEFEADYSWVNGVVWQRTHYTKVMEWGQFIMLPVYDQDIYIDKVTKGGWVYDYGEDTTFATFGSGVYPESNVIQFNGVPLYKIVHGNTDSNFIAAAVNTITGEPLGSMFVFQRK